LPITIADPRDHVPPIPVITMLRSARSRWPDARNLQLRRRKMTGVVLLGVSTSSGVDATARAAYEHGYNITFAADAISDLDAAAHDWAMKRSYPRLGEIDSTDAILGLLWTRPAEIGR
jgi:nicotinamidase-related amidase